MAMKQTNNRSAVKHYFFHGIKRNLTISIVCLFLHLISFPVALGSLTYFMKKYADDGFYTDTYMLDILCTLSVIFTAVAVAAGILMALVNFSYLRKKHEADMYLSFPLSSKQRFFSDYFSGLISYILPVIIVGLICFAESFICTSVVSDLGKLQLNATQSISLSTLVAEGYLLLTVAMTMLYTICVLVCTLCGNIFETLFHIILVNGLIPGMILLVTYISFNQVTGISTINTALPLLSKTSPVGAGIGFCLYAYLIEESVLLPSFIIKYALWLILFSVIYTVISFILYRIRKAEDVSKPYVFKTFYHIISTCLVFAICAIIPVDTSVYIIPMIIAAAVVYLIFEVVSKRGFKKFYISIIKCAVTVIASIILIGILNTPYTFGIAKKVPDAEDVKSVNINYIGVNQSMYYSSLTFTGEDAINVIVQAHQNCVDNIDYRSDFSGFLDDYDSDIFGYTYWDYPYTITYTLKNGKTLTRTYELSVSDFYILTMLEDTDEYAQQAAKMFEDYPSYVFVFENGNAKHYDIQESSLGKEYYTQMVKKLSAAIKNDLSARTLEQIRNPETPCGVIGSYDGEIYFYSYDKEIIKAVEEISAQSNNNLVSSDDYDETYGFYNSSITLITKFNMSDGDDHSYNYLINLSDDQQWTLALIENSEYTQLQEELIKNAVPYTFDAEAKYAISVDYYNIGELTLFVPSELNDKAERFFELCQAYDFSDRLDEYYEDEYGNEHYISYYSVDESNKIHYFNEEDEEIDPTILGLDVNVQVGETQTADGTDETDGTYEADEAPEIQASDAA